MASASRPLTCCRIKGPFQVDLEALFLGAGTVIGKVDGFIDESIDIDMAMLSRTFARVQQHVLDDGVCALAVLDNLVEIVAQSIGQFSNFGACLIITRHSAKSVPQFVDQFSRDTRKIVDEVERVFDLVRDPSGQLTKRGKLLRLDKAVLRGSQIFQRLRQLARTILFGLEQPYVLDSDRRLIRERGDQLDLLVSEWPQFGACQNQDTNRDTFAEHRHAQYGAKNRLIFAPPPKCIRDRLSHRGYE